MRGPRVSAPRSPATENVPAPSTPRENILFQALRSSPPGTWVELGSGAVSPAHSIEFERVGWRGIKLCVAETEILSDPLAGLADIPVYWMAVAPGALEHLAGWQAGACRPLVIVISAALLAPIGPAQPIWQIALARNGYASVIEDDDHAYFVRHDQAGLQSTLTYLAIVSWRKKLQASRRAHAEALRVVEQERGTVARAQASIGLAQSEVQALKLQLAAVYASTSWKSTKPMRWGIRLLRQPSLALRQFGAFAAELSHRVLRGTAPTSAHVRSLAELPPIHPSNIIGPQFKTLLLDELNRGVAPTVP